MTLKKHDDGQTYNRALLMVILLTFTGATCRKVNSLKRKLTIQQLSEYEYIYIYIILEV